MKKKMIIPMIVGFVLIIGIIGCFLWNNRTVSIITLDINPSIRINLNKKNEVKKIIAVNKDAEKIVKNISLKNDKKIETVINRIADEVEGNGFLTEFNLVQIILYTDGNITSNKVKEMLGKSFNEDGISADVVVVKKITKDDKKLAKKYNMNPAKAAYINSIIKDKPYMNVKDLVDKSVGEIKNSKETGYYCESGYILDGDRCLKEKKRVKASTGDICPNGYYDYNGNCYEMNEGTITDKLICREDSTLQGNMCIDKQIYDAVPKCSDEYDGGLDKCVEKKYVGDAVEYCRITPGEDLLYNHRCLGRKPTINGGCLGSDVVIDGWCYDTSATSGYEADWKCEVNGEIQFVEANGDHKCYERVYSDVPSYICEGEGKLEGKKCVIIHKERAFNERICPNGYTKVDMDICINLNNMVSKESGFVCDYPDSRMIDDTCILYDAKEAKNQ
ncbi:MAG: hypothetical protein IKF71_03375 [Bacilli bacterium]|nr:hypothetical protein [Bacilli bacterium]